MKNTENNLPEPGSSASKHPLALYQSVVQGHRNPISITAMSREDLIIHLAFAMDVIESLENNIASFTKVLNDTTETWYSRTPEAAGLQGAQLMKKFMEKSKNSSFTEQDTPDTHDSIQGQDMENSPRF